MNKNKKDGMRIVPSGVNKCIWMDAGTVSYKLCDNEFQCTSCAFDKAMSNKVEKEKQIYEKSDKSMYIQKPKMKWNEKFRQLSAEQRKCRYMLMGEVSYKVCPNNFNCGNCTFDQMMQDRIQPEINKNIAEFDKVAGFYIDDSLQYFRNHLWVSLERNGKYKVGIDDMARRIIGSIENLRLPKIGKKLDFEEYGMTIGHKFGEIDVFSPIKGTVEQINPKILEKKELVTEEPYHSGWLFYIEPESIVNSNKNLLKGAEVRKWMVDEVDQLVSTIQDGKVTMHDGAEITMNISEHISKEKWQMITKNHLYIN